MAQQPLPITGSITFFFHLAVIALAQLRNYSKTVSIIMIFFFLGILFGLFYIKNNTLHGLPGKQVNQKILNEKTEKIGSTDFLNQEHFIGWLPWWDEDRVIKSLQNAKNSLEVISPLWFKLSSDGVLVETPATKKKVITDIASDVHMRIIPVINNETDTGFDKNRVHILLSDEAKKTKFINDAVVVALKNNYAGWDIDWEQKDASDKDTYTAFLQQFAGKLHEHALVLTVTVQAKTDTSKDEDESKSDDWKALGKIADEVRIMAYDFHYDGSEPGAVTTLDELEAVLDYAEKTIPKEKTVLGVAMYGYDWNDTKGESIQYEDALQSVAKHHGTTIRDSESEELYGEYVEGLTSHTLWFTDTKSILRILYIGNNYNITKFSFWRVGGEDPSFWSLKKSK